MYLGNVTIRLIRKKVPKILVVLIAVGVKSGDDLYLISYTTLPDIYDKNFANSRENDN